MAHRYYVCFLQNLLLVYCSGRRRAAGGGLILGFVLTVSWELTDLPILSIDSCAPERGATNPSRFDLKENKNGCSYFLEFKELSVRVAILHISPSIIMIARTVFLLAALFTRSARALDASFLQFLPPSSTGGGCWLFRGCGEELDCVSGRCFPMNCLAEAANKAKADSATPPIIQELQDAATLMSGDADAGEQAMVAALSNIDEDSQKEALSFIENGMVPALSQCLEDPTTIQGDEFAVLPFVGLGYEFQIIFNEYGFFSLTLLGSNSTTAGTLFSVDCSGGIGGGIEIGVFVMLGAWLTDDPRGEWTLLEIGDVIPVAIDIPAVFYREGSSGLEYGFAFAIGATGGADLFSLTTCTVS